MGYLFYDTGFSLAFFSLRSGAVMLAHHIVGLAGCAIGAGTGQVAACRCCSQGSCSLPAYAAAAA